jgi:hypothetical protein
MAEKTLLERVEEAARHPVPDDSLKSTPRPSPVRDAESVRQFEQKMPDLSDYSSLLITARRRA